MRTPAGAAFDAFLPGALGRSAAQIPWRPSDGPLPVLFLSHGAPPLFDDGGWMDELIAWTTRLPKPRAILIVSAHWESAPLAISATAASTPLVYDFGGFDERYYSMTYATPDASWLAAQVDALMPDHQSLHQHANRGLDHGAWVPLKAMYPAGDVPVLQLSLPTHRPDQLMALGERLRPLREAGVLIVGSGFMTHGLPYLTRDMITENAVPRWSRDFDAWAWDAAQRNDVDALAGFRDAPGMPYAHPSAEHFSPLFVVMGASTPDTVPTTAIGNYMWGLSRRSLQYA